jgi:hypothetical protein
VHHEEGPFRQSRFDHRQHVRFAWAVLGECGAERAERVVTEEIRSFADVNAPGRYHETLTRFWLRLVAHTRAHGSLDEDFDHHVERFPILMDKRAPSKHYTAVLLGSDTARAEFVEPDLVPLP